MTTSTLPAAGMAPRVGLPQVLRAEWTKFWSVRSTWWCLLGMIVATIGFSALFSWGTAATLEDIPPEERAGLDATEISISGLILGQLAVAVLGVLTITAEYSTGGIRSTLVAVPRRGLLVLAKALVLVTVALVIGALTCLVSFAIGQALLGAVDLGVSLGDPNVLRAVLGGGLYLAASALFGFALGTLLRNSAGGIVLAVALLFVVPPLTNLLPGDWGDTVTKRFTSNAGQRITAVTSVPDAAAPWTGYLAFTAWWAVILAAGVVLMQRRDA